MTRPATAGVLGTGRPGDRIDRADRQGGANRQDRRGLAARLGWSVASQGLSSATNLGLTLLLALSTTADALGRTLSVLAVYLLALTLGRSLITESSIAAGGEPGSPADRASVAWIRARRRILALASAAMTAAVVVGLVVDLDRPTMALVIGSLPVLLLQDGQRYAAWAADRPAVATALDGCWLAVSLSLTAIVVVSGAGLGARSVVAVWVAGAVVSWLLGLILVERGPKRCSAVDVPAHAVEEDAVTADGRLDRAGPATPRGERREPGGPRGSDRYRQLAISQALMAVAVNLGPVAVAVLFSPTMTAAIKIVLVPYTVILSLFAGIRVVTLPAIRRAIDGGMTPSGAGGGGGSVWPVIGWAGGVASVAAIVTLGLASLVPEGRGGESLAMVGPYLPVGAMLCVLYVVGQQLADAVALAGHPEAVNRRLAAIGVEWLGLVCGAAMGGVGGLMIGWMSGLSAATAIWLHAWVRRPRRL